jgi:hypothetical protein
MTDLDSWKSTADIGVAVGTLILAGFAILQWRETRKTAQRQLRAYVLNSRAVISNIVVGGDPQVEVEIKNWGQTPAYEVTATSNITLAAFPLKEFPSQPPSVSKITVGPGSHFFRLSNLGLPLTPEFIRGSWPST